MIFLIIIEIDSIQLLENPSTRYYTSHNWLFKSSTCSQDLSAGKRWSCNTQLWRFTCSTQISKLSIGHRHMQICHPRHKCLLCQLVNCFNLLNSSLGTFSVTRFFNLLNFLLDKSLTYTFLVLFILRFFTHNWTLLKRQDLIIVA